MSTYTPVGEARPLLVWAHLPQGQTPHHLGLRRGAALGTGSLQTGHEHKKHRSHNSNVGDYILQLLKHRPSVV